MTRRSGAVNITGEVCRVGQLYCVVVPAEVVATLGDGSRLPVDVQLGNAAAKTSLVRTRDGDYRLYLPTEVRRPAAVSSGDEVKLRVTLDPTGGEPALPDDLLAHLRQIEGGVARLNERSPADRRQLVRWLDGAKTPETRARRLEQAVERVLAGRPKPTRKSAARGSTSRRDP